jgi:hypothetical protein
MTIKRSRREFLADVGRGTMIASVGYGLALDLGLARAGAADGPASLNFGSLEPLVEMMQATSASRIVAAVVEKISAGTDLKDLVAAAALANARTFGGEDYVGFHTMMALAPAYHMSRDQSDDRRALPVLKVLYRNTNRIQEFGGRPKEVLHQVEACCVPEGRPGGEVLREAVRKKDVDAAEKTFAALASGQPSDAFNDLLWAVQDNTEVHRTVLPYRAWDLLGIIGKDHAHTLLRQSVRYCVKSEREWNHNAEQDEPRRVLPRMFDRFKLASKTPGDRAADDTWVAEMCKTIFESTPAGAAEAVAAALADGMSPDSLGEALSLAANQLILRDAGRTAREVQPNKPVGSVHGDSIGVHACDSANAWRNMARAGNPRNTFACLILGAYQVALDRVNRGGDFMHWTARPFAEDLEKVRTTEPGGLLRELTEAIHSNDQARACAIAGRCGELGHPARPVFDVLLGFATSEDGALHAEKYYRTVSEEFASTRPAFRWRQLVALARVTASEYGRPAPGYDEACERLKVGSNRA